MRRIFGGFVVVLAAVLVSIGFAGCGAAEERKEKLNAPSGLLYNEETELLSWFVQFEAAGVQLEIDGVVLPEIIPQSTRTFSCQFLAGGPHQARMKAVASGNDYWTDSPWSDYTQFTKSHRITLHKNGGEFNSALIQDFITVIAGHGFVPLPIPVKSGFAFGGWFLADDFHGAAVTTQTIVELANTDLYAKFTPKSFNISFDKNGGEGTTESRWVEFGGEFGELPTLAKEGCDFVGWFTQRVGGTQILPESRLGTAEDLVLYAHFEFCFYNVVLNLNGGTAVNQTEFRLQYGQGVSLPVTSRVGYSFSGWWFDGYLVANPTGENLCTGYWYWAQDAELFAGFSPRRIALEFAEIEAQSKIVTFDYNYDGAPADLQFTLTAFNSLPYPMPTRSGWKFCGWYSNPNFAEYSRAKLDEDISPESGAITYYAKWAELTADKGATASKMFSSINIGDRVSINYTNWGATNNKHEKLYSFVVLKPQILNLAAGVNSGSNGEFIISVTLSNGTSVFPNVYSNNPITASSGGFSRDFEPTVGVLYYVRLERNADRKSPDCWFSLTSKTWPLAPMPSGGGKLLGAITQTAVFDQVAPVAPIPDSGFGEFLGWFTQKNGQGLKLYDFDGTALGLISEKWNYLPENENITLFAFFL
jgi:uncharacterized repeat protein (TIGR02543 family)